MKKYFYPTIEIINLYTEDIMITSPGLPGNSGEDVPGIVLPGDQFPMD